jgi:hypothetical protein
MSFGSKSKTPTTAQPTATPVETTPTGPIQRAATNAEARDRVASNASADLLASDMAPDAAKAAQASLMG